MEMKVARDGDKQVLQFSHVDTASYQNITAAVEFTNRTHVRICPTTADAWIKITAVTNTPATGEGMLIVFGADYTTTINAGEWIGSSSEINVVPLGDL